MHKIDQAIADMQAANQARRERVVTMALLQSKTLLELLDFAKTRGIYRKMGYEELIRAIYRKEYGFTVQRKPRHKHNEGDDYQ